MTLLEAQEIFAYWGESPPVHLAAKALLGGFGKTGTGKPADWRDALGDPRTGTAPVRAGNDDSAALIAAPPPGLAVIVRPKGTPPRRVPTFDASELAARSRAAQLRRQGIG